MDTNDNETYGTGSDTQAVDQNYQQVDISGTEQPAYGQSPYAYGGDGNSKNAQGGSGGPDRKEKKRRILVPILITMILSLVVGGVLTAFVVMPAVDAADELIQDIAMSTSASDVQSEEDEVSSSLQDAQQQESVTTDSVDIGGETPEIDSSSNPIVQIAQEVGPAVVALTVSSSQSVSEETSTEEVSGYGTGIILTEDGYIVTNNHVIAGSTSVLVTLIDGTEYPASIVGTDSTTDLAVVKIDATGLTAAALGDSDDLQVGETVVAIGNPLGLELAGSVTSGIVSALNREINTNGYSQKYIQTDAAINPGNSGGALVNMEGEVIGINTLKSYLAGYDDYGQSISTEGIGFAIPISTARPIIEQLITEGKVERPGIGISCLVDSTNTYNPSGSPDGVTVVEIVSGGPADIAGLEPYDIITSIEGTAVGTVEELTSAIQTHNIGDVLDITVWRSGQEYQAQVTVGDLNEME